VSRYDSRRFDFEHGQIVDTATAAALPTSQSIRILLCDVARATIDCIVKEFELRGRLRRHGNRIMSTLRPNRKRGRGARVGREPKHSGTLTGMSASVPKPAEPVVDFYFDYLSPFAYFAALRLPELCRTRGARLRYRPVLFAGLLDHWGQRGPAEIPPKAIHTFKLCARYAALHEVPFRSPRFHPYRPLDALRVSLKDVAGDGQPKVVEAIFHAGWGEGADLADRGELAAAIDAAGLDGDALMNRASEPTAKSRLRAETEQAIERGVFGIPTMIVADELFWGVDQLEYLELHLDGRDPLQAIDFATVGSEGSAAVRPASVRPIGRTDA
jgi:2-hydroxychromene-2-carboxylate isomerase